MLDFKQCPIYVRLPFSTISNGKIRIVACLKHKSTILQNNKNKILFGRVHVAKKVYYNANAKKNVESSE